MRGRQHIHVCPDCRRSETCRKAGCQQYETLSCSKCYEARREGAAAFAARRKMAQ